MFSLCYGFVQYMCQQDEFHVLILGLDKAGKTNVLEKLKTLLSDLNGRLGRGRGVGPAVGVSGSSSRAKQQQVSLFS